MAPTALHCIFYDPSAVKRVREALGTARPDGPPSASFLYPDEAGPARLGVFSGSFNPLTTAHTAVAARAHQAFDLDLTAFALSTSTIDKECITGMLLEDRLLTLELYARCHPGLGVLLLNRGLYVEQAEALRQALPGLEDLFFVVGFDKIVQIFDPRYYADRDASLGRLFALASFIVAPRGSDGEEELAALRCRPENRRYAGGVFSLPVPPRFRDLSSTAVRAALEHGQKRVAGLPLESRACLQATGAYESPYAGREALVAALAGIPGPLEPWQTEVLMRAIRGRGETGRRLRRALARTEIDGGGAVRLFLEGGPS